MTGTIPGLNTEDLPDDLQFLTKLEAVKKVVKYQTQGADYSILLADTSRVQNVRVPYLEQLREDWEWVDATNKGVGTVLLKRRQ